MKPLMLFLPLRFILPALLAAFILFIIFYTTLYSIPNAEKQVELEVQEYFSETLNRTQGTVRYMFQQANKDAVVREVSNLGGVEGFNLVLLFDEHGKIITSNRFANIDRSLTDISAEMKFLDMAMLKQALGKLTSMRQWSADRKLLIGYYPVPIGLSKNSLRPDRVGLLYVEFDATLRKQRIRSFIQTQNLQISIIASMLLAVFLMLLHFNVTRRAMRLVNAAKLVSAGDLSKRAELQGHDELSMIGAAFDRMVDRLGQEQKLIRDGEERLHAIFDNVLDGIITISEKGIVETFNRSAEKIFGYAATEVIGRNVNMLMPEPYRSEHDGYLNNYLGTGRKKIIGIGRQVTGQRKNGETFPMDLAVTEMRLEGRRMFAGVVRDVSDRKKMEVELAKRVHDLGERIKEQACLYQLSSLSRETELPLDEFFMKAVNLLPPAWQYPEYTCARITCRGRVYSSSNYTSSNWRMMAPIITGSVEYGMVEVCYLKEMPPEHEGPFLLEEQNLIEAFAGQIGQTIDMRQAEEELRKQSRAVEQSPVSVMITDAAGKIEYVNAKFSEVTGYTAQEVMGKNPRIIQSGQTPEDVYRSMWQALQNGKEWRGKLQNRKKNGELFWEEMYISAIRDNEGRTTNFVAVKEDITERIKIERMKSEFISTVSHELRTPLTSIHGSLALIAGGVTGELPAAAKPMVDIALKNSERLVLLVNDILDIEKIEAGRMEFSIAPIMLMPLLELSLESNRAYAEQYKVVYEQESSVPGAVIQVDSNRLLQVFANLLSNAAKFSHAGGKVKAAVERHDECIRISIKDNGPGIPDEFRSRIFQKFTQADSSDTRNKGGTGLGLAITKAIVEQMGGSIGFDSQPDVETIFYVEFPEWKEQQQTGQAICHE